MPLVDLQSTYGCTYEGFIVKPIDQILASIEADLQAINVMNDQGNMESFMTNGDDEFDNILHQLVVTWSDELSMCWGAAYNAYTQYMPKQAMGYGLGGLAQIKGMNRILGSYAEAWFNLNLSANVTLGPGQIINYDGTSWMLKDAVTSTTAGLYPGHFIAQVKGLHDSMVPGANAQISTPVAGWNVCVYKEPYMDGAIPLLGSNDESDSDLRQRMRTVYSLNTQGSVDVIYGNVMQQAGVIACFIWVNNGIDPTPITGLPPKEFCICVQGGTDQDVAQAIYDKAPAAQCGWNAGAPAAQQRTIPIYDNTNFPHYIKFVRPTSVIVTVNLTIRVTGSEFVSGISEDTIRENIIQYATYGDDTNWNGFALGENMDVSRLYTPINMQPDIRVVSLTVSAPNHTVQTDFGQYLKANFWEQFTFDAAHINITLAS